MGWRFFVSLTAVFRRLLASLSLFITFRMPRHPLKGTGKLQIDFARTGLPAQILLRHRPKRPSHLFLVLVSAGIQGFWISSLITTVPALAQQNVKTRPLLLTSVAAVHDLAPDLAAQARVQLTGTITFYDPAEREMFLQDATGGVYIETDKIYPVEQGDMVSVDGTAAASYRTEIALDPVIHVLSKGSNLAAPKVAHGMLTTGELDSRLATVRGTVRAVDVEQHENAPILHLDVEMEGGEIEVYQPVSVLNSDTLSRYVGLDGNSLLDTTVEITGVVGGVFDTKSQLTGIIIYVQKSTAIKVLKPARLSPLKLPSTDIDQVFQSLRLFDASSRLRIRGVLTYYKPGDSAVLEENGKSIFVLTRETKHIAIGNIIDAVGFASDREYAPSLRQAELFDTGKHGSIAPKLVTYDDALSGLYSDNLISLEGTLISELYSAGVETLVINADGHYVTGRLESTAAKLPNLRVGTLVRLTGICRIVPGGPWRAPTFFHVEMREPSDLTMLSTPSWWTVRHLFGLLGMLLVLASAIVAWAMLLRRRVRQQTAHIERTMLIAKRRSSLLERISSNYTLATLLGDVCECVTSLLPGTLCIYTLDAELGNDPQNSANHSTAAAETLLYSMSLTGADDKPVGQLSVYATDPLIPLNNRHEVFSMMSEVANLALQQSLLYQGLVHHSTHDALTDLPNRRLCEHRLHLALSEAAQHGTRVAVFYIDVNRFKHVNDKYGHRVGDLYLKAISSRLEKEIRSTDTLARIGGDEFLVIAPQTTASCDAADLCSRLQRSFDRPFNLDETHIEGSASFGLACYPENGTTAEELKRFADNAMYLAKRGTAVDEAHKSVRDINIVTPDELEVALARGQFRLAYQPQFAPTGQLRGMEALLRLQDAIMGTLTPDAFISVAERCDTILPLGRWVLARALEDAMRWGLHDGSSVLLIVNVSMRQVAQPTFAEEVLELLEQSGFPPDRLEIELTERTLVSDCKEVRRQLERLRDAGIRVSLDDFGTGQSSLSLLHRLPIDTIKIDRSFIAAMNTEPSVLPVIQAITYMAQGLGKRIVAEGVETLAPVETLLRMGEMDFQGYLLSRPVSAEQVEQVLPFWRSGLPMPTVFQTQRDGELYR